MKKYLKVDEWKIIEDGFNPEYNRISESIFSIGNGKMGQRANFEEKYSGDSLQGSYVAGVYYPDKTRVGWWKIGYPEYFAKVINSANWIGIDVDFDNEELDLAKNKVEEFVRVLNMKEGFLERKFTAILAGGKKVHITSIRFCSMSDTDLGVIKYTIKSSDFSGILTLTSYIDADVKNEDSNYDEKFWNELDKEASEGRAIVTANTKKLDFHVAAGMDWQITRNGVVLNPDFKPVEKEKYAGNQVKINLGNDDEIVIYKYAAIVSSLNHNKDQLTQACYESLDRAVEKGFDNLIDDQRKAWSQKWEESDITIEGDPEAQQGIRFNIFQLNQTYTGEDERLNIGPKGFTGEKYGGSTYWDTEAYCLPFYLSTADPHVPKNLLIYRYKHLQKAIENAKKLGFTDGAALYPMVTMNGEECHNEWEITFEEIHRNGAIAYAIYDYIRYTGDQGYMAEYGLEVLIAIARFWAQRVNYSEIKEKYVILGVTGPNEYENNVNNNWYTNKIAVWCLQYAVKSIEYVKNEYEEQYSRIIAKHDFDEEAEIREWKNICSEMFYPEDPEKGVFLQQDGFQDKKLMKVSEIDENELPINQNWSWDRILRSCFIKQADVLQGIYFFEEEFDQDTIQKNFDYYEPMTVHESSLSPCVHVILAAKLGYHQKAYDLYLRTSRLDLDDYNNDTEDGCHITSMAGTWMSVVKGFGGLKVHEGHLYLDPFIPEQWNSYSFKIRFRGTILKISVSKEQVEVENFSDRSVGIYMKGEFQEISGKKHEVFS